MTRDELIDYTRWYEQQFIGGSGNDEVVLPIVDRYLADRGEKKEAGTCQTCKYEEAMSFDEPCKSCNVTTNINWQPK